MSFIVEKEITLVGMFSQNGFQTIKDGAPVDIVFDNAPGPHLSRQDHCNSKRYRSGADCRVRNAGANQYVRRRHCLSSGNVRPYEMSRDSLRLGMLGSATAFAENRARSALLASILVWVSSDTAYL